MEYQIHLIESKEQLAECPIFQIDHYAWKHVVAPKAYGRLAYWKGHGLYLQMVCEESDPLRVYTQPHDPVFQDSAMEFFFTFPPTPSAHVKPDLDFTYLNFEMNANGAMFARRGTGRRNVNPRVPLTDEQFSACPCTAQIEEDKWSLSLFIPLSLLRDVFGAREPEVGGAMYCNFYKISQTPEIEHYASFSPIDDPEPNFHQPQYFAKTPFIQH